MIRIIAPFSLALLIAFYFGTNTVKYETKEAREELQKVDRSIEREKEAIKILSAEWSYLTRPDNLRQLAETHLGLETVQARQIAAIEDVPYLGLNLFEDNDRAVPIREEKKRSSSTTMFTGTIPDVITIARAEFTSDEGLAP